MQLSKTFTWRELVEAAGRELFRQLGRDPTAAEWERLMHSFYVNEPQNVERLDEVVLQLEVELERMDDD